jgi:hypothetical protein
MTTSILKVMGKRVAKDYVVTPSGPRHKSRVHLVEAGHKIDASGGRLREYDSNSRVVRDFGETKRKGVSKSKPVGKSAPVIPAPKTSYIVSGDFENGTGSPILSFSTSWIVPSGPLSRSGQIVFIWNGIIPGGDGGVLQPVLQWGNNDISGGDYWEVVSYWAESESHFFHSPAVRVQEGALLTGVITQTAANGSEFSYNSEFAGIPKTILPVSNVDQLAHCFLVIEAHVTKPSDFPTREIKMRAISVRTAAGPQPTIWTPKNWSPTDYGQQAFVRTNGLQAEVDLYCYDLKQIAVISDSTQSMELFYTSRNDALYQRSQIPGTSDWGDDKPLGLGDFATQLSPVLTSGGYLSLFYVGTDNNIYRNDQTLNGWKGETAFGGSAKQIAAAVNADGRLEVFYIGTNDKIYHVWEEIGGGSSGHQTLGGTAKQIAVSANADGRLELFYIGTNNVLYHNWQIAPNGDWNGEASFGTSALQLALGQNLDGALELFYITLDSQLYHFWQTAPNNGWAGGDNFGLTSAQQLAAGRDTAGHQHLFYIDTNDQINFMAQTVPNGGWGPANAFAGPASKLAVGRNADGRLEIFYVGANNALFQKWQTAPNVDEWSAATQI